MVGSTTAGTDGDAFVRSLQQSEAVRLLADAYPSFLSYVDTSYCYLFCNRAYEQTFGKSIDELVGKSVIDVWGEHAFTVIKPKLDRAFAGETVTFESAHGGRHRTASYVPHRASDGGVRGALVFVQDTTELTVARSAIIHAERMASLGRVVAGLMHELNTPLAAVRANAQTMTRSAERSQEWLARGDDKALAKVNRALGAIVSAGTTVEEAVVRLDTLLASLRRFAAVDEAEVKVCGMGELVGDTVSLLAHRVGGSVQIVTNCDELPEIACRAASVNQIFMTLLTNAVEAVDGSGKVEVSGRATDEGVLITVTDDGCGIEPERLGTLFEPSFAAGAERTRAGFGLFVARNLARAHGGDITVESELGVGSRFVVQLAAQS